jgi:hypothetical protein
MAERLAGGNAAVALLANTAATCLMLGVLISLLGGISGSHSTRRSLSSKRCAGT